MTFSKEKLDTKLLIKKMSLSAIILALCVIFMKFLPIYLPALPSLRVSLGPGLIIFSSIYLGPLWGMVIGSGADAIGFLFDRTGFPYSPAFTIMYGVLGFISWFIYKLITRIRNYDNLILIFTGLLLGLLLISIPAITKSTIISGLEIKTWFKALLISIVVLLTIGMLVFVFLYSRKQQRQGKSTAKVLYNAITCMILEIIVMLFIGGLIKSHFFSISFEITAFIQLILLFINVPINTFLVTTLSGLLNTWGFNHGRKQQQN